MNFSTSNFKRIMLILSPCAVLTSFNAQATVNLNGTPEDYKAAKHSGRKCVVMLASDHCGHCKTASPIFAQIANDPANESVDFLKLQSSENGDIMHEQELDGVPAFLFIDEAGNVKNKELGLENEDTLKTMVRNHVGSSVSENVDAMAPVEQAPVHEEGILDKLKGLFIGLFDTIKNIFVTIFDWLKGLFNR